MCRVTQVALGPAWPVHQPQQPMLSKQLPAHSAHTFSPRTSHKLVSAGEDHTVPVSVQRPGCLYPPVSLGSLVGLQAAHCHQCSGTEGTSANITKHLPGQPTA